MLKHIYKPVIFAAICVMLAACSKSKGPLAIFNKLSPHDAYAQRLKDNGFDRTAMGSAWLLQAQQVIAKPLNITIPYKEAGYFADDKTGGTALRFNAKRGQKLRIAISKKPVSNFDIYADLFEEQNQQPLKLLASADTVGALLEHEVKQTGNYILRLQPELLRAGEYTLTITAGPSLSFPVSAVGKPRIGSFWGDGRDEGGRKHEGIDIFAPKRTPAIAAANGTVTGVTVNNLGGNVVFMRPDNQDYSLYYAHLDLQSVQQGQTVTIGDTIGLVGNTGNARTTPPHLHFGIYTSSGAIDPLAFVDREVKEPAPISAPLKYLNATVRTSVRNGKLYNLPSDKGYAMQTLELNTPLTVSAAADGWYKVNLPDGLTGYINSRNITEAGKIRNISLKKQQSLLNAPDSINAARKKLIVPGEKVTLLGTYQNYQLVKHDNETGWIAAN
ncbi:peptidoglycan DD-metalloendopeptidase family protein [Mucilaginibacter pallidiroseus]|uniref:Peptidoglycan DD-metalloendopeptidase family protein n=1 Tax=Mucilaginibacter pallidiroseus TaxID=2599295 RepID=A0A563UCM8_9SPHI|nr:peptidoglycan DD-metalloendopeptidase family protein [Mucilaginibacter pallidiroseus]TWR29080.1 peptidoglycan DD-metalloendopeptidase family protein [Mucilaginibacter pallidiroseus]